MLPIASADRFYVVNEGKLQALDAATGETIKVYTDAGTPIEFLHIGGTLVTTDAKTSTIRAIIAASSRMPRSAAFETAERSRKCLGLDMELLFQRQIDLV